MAYTLSTLNSPGLIPGQAPLEAILGVGVPHEGATAASGVTLDSDGVKLYEALAVDFRPAPIAAPYYLLVFNTLQAPQAGAVPFIPAVEITGYANLTFEEELSGALVCPAGCWIAISTNPLIYAAINSSAFSLMLRTGS